MAKNKHIIKHITIDIGGTEIRLTREAAKELKEALEELFGSSEVKHVHHYDYWGWNQNWRTDTIIGSGNVWLNSEDNAKHDNWNEPKLTYYDSTTNAKQMSLFDQS